MARITRPIYTSIHGGIGMSGEAILFVDDEASILNAIRRELRDWAQAHGSELLFAGGPEEALETIEAHKEIVLVVSDLRMPVMTGADLLLKVRSRWPKIMSILLTGFSETDEIMKAIKAGVFSFILKPWDPGYLRAEIEKALFVYAIRSENEHYLSTLQEELYWAGELQRRLLKIEVPESALVTFLLENEPVPNLYCGGDYYDILPIGDEKWLILIGDVAGHGLKAALFTEMLKSIINPDYVKPRTGEPLSPADFLSWLNGRISVELERVSDLFITFCAVVIDLRELKLTVANAGHMPPYLIRNGAISRITVPGPALGAFPDVTYTNVEKVLEKGDLLCLYTDGLLEIGQPGKMPEREILEKALAETGFSQYYAESVFAAMRRAAGVEKFNDDLTLIAAYVR
jgi:phosphoserine phosphatase RsbU/P